MRCTTLKSLIIAAAAVTSTTAVAGEWTMMPFQDEGWSPDFTLAVTTGPMSVDVPGVDNDTASGVQLSLDCPWFAPPSGVIRQQFNYNMFDDGNAKITTFEINPRWYTSRADLRFGFGPGFGYAKAEPSTGAGSTINVWSLQFGADVEYRSGAFFLGAGARMMVTQEDDIGGGTMQALDNNVTQLKAGFNF